MYLIQFEVGHEPETGTWTVSHQADLGPSHGAWLTDKPPRYETWKPTCDHLIVDDEWAAVLAADLDRTVSDMQARCSCRECRKAVRLRMAAERERKLEQAFAAAMERPVVLADAGTAARYWIADPGDLAEAMGVAGATTHPAAISYTRARTRYMETGTIADKEAMLACVTGTEPDLETLGRDWEPAPERGQRQHARYAGTWAAIAFAAALAVCSQLLGHPLLFAAGAVLSLVSAFALISGLRN